MGELYHSSHKRGLQELIPSISSHGRQWLYASKDLIISVLFLAPMGGDLTCQIGRRSGVPYLCERFQGAFELRYKGQSGSIYVVDDKDFVENETDWCDELVCAHPKKPLREIPVEDIHQYLVNFEKMRKLRIYRYPERPREIPKDDSDLVTKCVEFLKVFGQGFWSEIERFHPALIERIKAKASNESEF